MIFLGYPCCLQTICVKSSGVMHAKNGSKMSISRLCAGKLTMKSIAISQIADRRGIGWGRPIGTLGMHFVCCHMMHVETKCLTSLRKLSQYTLSLRRLRVLVMLAWPHVGVTWNSCRKKRYERRSFAQKKLTFIIQNVVVNWKMRMRIAVIWDLVL